MSRNRVGCATVSMGFLLALALLADSPMDRTSGTRSQRALTCSVTASYCEYDLNGPSLGRVRHPLTLLLPKLAPEQPAHAIERLESSTYAPTRS